MARRDEAVETYVDSNGQGPQITEDTPTDQVIPWLLKRFGRQRMVMTTSFGMEGCALIDMYARHAAALTVVYVDTHLFFPETYTLCDRLVERYPKVNFVNGGTNLTLEQQAAGYGDELWKTNPDQCCKLRKSDPMRAALKEVDVWTTGLRRSQSPSRKHLRLIEWDWRFQVIKVNPLFKWERGQVWDYVRNNDVPYNELHLKGYPTIGCVHCTVAVPGSKPGSYTRAGRWPGAQKTECGLHGGAGI